MRTKLIIKIIENEVHYGDGYRIPLSKTNFPFEHNKFKEHKTFCWETEIIDPVKGNTRIKLKIIDYESNDESAFEQQFPKSLLAHIEFLNIDFDKVDLQLRTRRRWDFYPIENPNSNRFPTQQRPMLSNSSKNQHSPIDEGQYRYKDPYYEKATKFTRDDSEIVLEEKGKIKFEKIEFLDRVVYLDIPFLTFQSHPKDEFYRMKLDFSRKELEQVRNYIKKELGSELTLNARIAQTKITKRTRIVDITTDYFDGLNDDLIKKVKFKFAKKRLSQTNINKLISNLEFLEKDDSNFLTNYNMVDFFDALKQDEESIHSKELHFLEALHSMTSRFPLHATVDSDFSFIFFVETENRYNFISETYRKDFATYIWSIEKTKVSGADEFYEMFCTETQELCDKKRMKYRNENKESEMFKFIEHTNDGTEKGFQNWKINLKNIIGKVE